MSWFASGLETLNQLSETVQNAIPLDKELLAKLTLNTDEMKAERQQFGDEAKMKEEVKNLLAGMLPWETRDSERDILVEECKQAILALSENDETFYGPYEMPALRVKLDDDRDEEGEDDEDENGGNLDKPGDRFMPSEESVAKLKNLEPLPPLLQDFDLDFYVGLIERLLKEDPVLEEKQSRLSGKFIISDIQVRIVHEDFSHALSLFPGGGPREKAFWHNYFFHCAYTRYEAGLSVDEIFRPGEDDNKDEEGDQKDEVVDEEEELVVFDDKDSETESSTTRPAFVPDEANIRKQEGETAGQAGTHDPVESSPSGSAASEFEILEGDDDVEGADPELDELEAEIARELED